MEKEDVIYGKNPVLEAIRSDREINKILVAYSEKDNIYALAREKNIVVQNVNKNKLDDICNNKDHQGVVAYVSPHRYYSIEEIFDDAKQKNEKPFIIVLDQITDDNNLANIIRSAHVFGAHGIIMQNRRNSSLNSVVAKRSAGALEYMKVARVTNIPRTLDLLKEKGVWIYGTDAEAKENVSEIDLTGNVALVIGSEGKGMRRLTSEKCDFLVKIPMAGKISSLNAANALAVCAYEVYRQKTIKGD